MRMLALPSSTRDGFSLVDVCVALAILATALGILIGSVFYALRLEQANEETAVASQIMRTMIERLNASDFETIYAAYNSDPNDDPNPGVDSLAELAATTNDPLLTIGKKDGPVVSVLFPGDEVGQLREDGVDKRLGMPRDLNGDNGTDDQDHSADYTILPVTLQLTWEGISGPRTLEMSTLLRDR